jgi:hypothetical protein
LRKIAHFSHQRAAKMASKVSMKVLVIVFFSILLIGQYTMLKLIHQGHEESVAASTNAKVDSVHFSEHLKKFKEATSAKVTKLQFQNKLNNHKVNMNHFKPKHLPLNVKSYHQRQQKFQSQYSLGGGGNNFKEAKGQQQPLQKRIAVVIPYIGPELPSWFPLFAASCEKSKSIADWIIFTAGTRVPSSKHDINNWMPLNIKFIELGISGLAKLHARLVDPSDRPKATELFQESLHSKPYGLVEFKPAVGHIFHDYLLNYSHWCFSDLDLIMGDLPNWTDELFSTPFTKTSDIKPYHQNIGGGELSHSASATTATPPKTFPVLTGNESEEDASWDLFTYSFGDQFRMYTRGQWTVHRNVDKVCFIDMGSWGVSCFFVLACHPYMYMFNSYPIL